MKTIAPDMPAFLGSTIAQASFADVFVDGYRRSNGTYVQPHWRSSPDGNPYNNRLCCGNVNPHTGTIGRGYLR